MKQLLLAFLLFTPAAAWPEPDVLIHSGTVVATAADYEMDGTMWVAFTVLEDSTTYLYKSLGYGRAWEARFSLRRAGDLFDKLQLVVGEGDSGAIHLFYLINYQGGDLWQIRYNEGGMPVQSPVAVGPDTITDFAFCRDYTGSDYWLYAAVTNPQAVGGYRALRFLRSVDYGSSWAFVDSYAVQVRDPYLAAGAGSRIYFAAHSRWQGGAVHIWTNRQYLNASAWEYGLVTTDSDEVADPVVAAAFTQPESAATVWMLWSQDYQNSGDWDIKYSFSTNGGIAWSAPAFLAGTAAYDECFPDLRNYTSPGNQYVNASYIVDDDIVRRVHRRFVHAASPTQWSDTLLINQGSVGTGSEVRPKLCYLPGGPFTGAGCVFVGAGLNGCWWNAPYPVALGGEQSVAAERISVRPGVGRGSFHISTPSQAGAIGVYDGTGRLVRLLCAPNTWWDGRDATGRLLPPGVYLVRFAAGNYRATQKVVLQR